MLSVHFLPMHHLPVNFNFSNVPLEGVVISSRPVLHASRTMTYQQQGPLMSGRLRVFFQGVISIHLLSLDCCICLSFCFFFTHTTVTSTVLVSQSSLALTPMHM